GSVCELASGKLGTARSCSAGRPTGGETRGFVAPPARKRRRVASLAARAARGRWALGAASRGLGSGGGSCGRCEPTCVPVKASAWPRDDDQFLARGRGEDSTCRMEKYYHEKNGLRTGTARVTSRSSLRVANAWGSRRVAPAADHVLGALLECARGMPQAAAFRFLGRRAELDTVFDYDELLCCVAGAAGRLREAGVEPGDRVLLLCPPGPAYVVSLFGCFYA